MPPKLHILATCRNPDILRGTTLLFDTLRVGFPTAQVTVHSNALPEYARAVVQKLCAQNDCALVESPPTIHHEWIEKLLAETAEPFIILDTDVCFWKNCEEWHFTTA